MNPASRFGAGGQNNVLEVLWEDGERVFCRTSREGVDGTRRAVLAVLPAAEHPTRDSLDRLAHEYGLKDYLDGAWAVRPLELVRDGGQTMLLLESPGGEPLDRLIGPAMEPGRFLRLAVALAAALGRLHERGLVHKDFKPTNILVDSATGHVWLTGFGIASLLPRERRVPVPPEFIEGTLAYMAPEQTGRMNRSIDSRSDLYSLGITLYQMLTGSLPFTASYPMEWVHCHIARQPTPPNERFENVPACVSAIIMKLLAKTAEERYQTAAGVESDLRRCLADWETLCRIDEFPLGGQDVPDRLSDELLVAVRDSGPGLAAASLERVFEPFYTTKPGGLGIGLSICRSIIEAHGGRLWASPSVPQGAIFQFTLPVHTCGAP